MKSILVLGGGSAGLVAALTVKRRLPRLRVRVIRSPEIGVIGVGEGTTVDFPRHLFQYLRLDPATFFREVGPTWKLGIRFLWGPEPDFFYPFAQEYDHRYPDLPKSTGFYQKPGVRWVGGVSAYMAHGKAFPPRRDGPGPNLSFPHAYHLENHKLVSWLEAACREEGVRIDDHTVERVDHDGGRVRALHTADGERIEADLFIDASGFRSELLGRALGESFVDYGDALFCDRALIGGWSRRGDEPVLPYTTAETMDAGWCWRIEHDHRVNRGYVYSSRFLSDDAARAEFLAANPCVEGEPRIVRFSSRRARRGWVGNVVGVGNAAGFVEPLEATALHALCAQSRWIADSLLDQVPDAPTPTLIDCYNRLNAAMWDDIRDFLAVHYAFNRRRDTPFWRACLEETDLGGARPIVDFYRENGPSLLVKALMNPHNVFGANGYWAIMCGQQVPHDRPHEPKTVEEEENWRVHHRNLAKAAEVGLSPVEAKAAVLDPSWRW